MKSKIISGIKIYTFTFIYILLASFIYTFYLMNKNVESKLIEIIIGSSTFFILGLTFTNSIHKKAILTSTLIGITHYFLIRLIVFLVDNTFNINIVTLLIVTLSSIIGGILGIMFKKMF